MKWEYFQWDKSIFPMGLYFGPNRSTILGGKPFQMECSHVATTIVLFWGSLQSASSG